MASTGHQRGEPRALPGAFSFEEGDFHSLSEGLCRDPQYNDRRLLTRRRLASLAKQMVARASAGGLDLESRTSLHRPHTFNGQRVRRLWAYVTRPKAEKTRLRKTLGADLARDLDAAYRNLYLCLALESDALEVSLRVHPDGWYDGQNLVNRVKAEGQRGWLELLNTLDGYQLRLHDWRGEFPCGRLEPERLEEFFRYYQPGEHALAIERRFPAPEGARGAALELDAPELMVEECLRLVPLYRYAAWSRESDFLFTSS